ncbi:MAG: hypothetical protein JWQ87_4661 [Candidatus Sulfotelmatobacter sp.]|nr:hypothetical protein [Candidatus Sulfotelmatobacter sp.]
MKASTLKGPSLASTGIANAFANASVPELETWVASVA